MTDPIWPEFELFLDFMPVLVTSKFDEVPIKNEQASLETLFSHINIYFPRAPNSVGSKVGKNPGFISIAQPSGFYWENPGFTRVILGFTGFTG